MAFDPLLDVIELETEMTTKAVVRDRVVVPACRAAIDERLGNVEESGDVEVHLRRSGRRLVLTGGAGIRAMNRATGRGRKTPPPSLWNRRFVSVGSPLGPQFTGIPFHTQLAPSPGSGAVAGSKRTMAFAPKSLSQTIS